MADVHVLVIPKTHVSSILDPKALDGVLHTAMIKAVQHVAREIQLDETGFHRRTNASAPQVTPHTPWHILGPAVPPMKQA